MLFATDGHAELMEPAGRTLGLEGAGEALRAEAGALARRVVGLLGSTVTGWPRGREQVDGITFVVVRVAQ